MGPRPWRPANELRGALESGKLDYAIRRAEEIRIETGRPIDLKTAARFLPLVAAERPDAYDDWSLRWLARWIAEARGKTIDDAVDVATALAALPVDPDAFFGIERVV
jgi:hypothetical protein